MRICIRYGVFSIISFVLYSCTSKMTIAIQPYGVLQNVWVDTIQHTLAQVYEVPVYVLPRKSIPKSTFIAVKSPRYRADSLLKILKNQKPDTIDYVLGILNKDISMTKRDHYGNIKKPIQKYTDWGVFGLGYIPGPSCVVSTYRLKAKNQSVFIDRLQKVCVHEIGHILGLPHCTDDPNCVMRSAAETITTIDQVKLQLCDHCKSKI